MTAALAALLGPALLLAAGLGLAELLGIGRGRPAGRLGYGYLLGVAWVAGGLYALSHFADVPLRRPAVLALLAIPMILGVGARLLRLRRTDPKSRRRRPPLPALAALAVATVVSLPLLAEALARPVNDWDGRMTWGTQARYIRAAGTVSPPALAEPRWYVSHPHYPVLLPVAQVAVQEVLGAAWDRPLFRPLYVAFFPALLLVLWDSARRWAGPRAAAWTVLAVAVLPFPAFAPDGGAAGAYSDLPLGCFYGAGLALLLHARPGPREGIAVGLLLAAAVLAKREGIYLATWALLLAAAWLLARRLVSRQRQRDRPGRSPGRKDRASFHLSERAGGEDRNSTGAPPGVPARPPAASSRLLRRAAVLPAALLVAGAIALLASWQAGIPNRYYDDYVESIDPIRAALDLARRAPGLLPVLARRMASFKDWGLFWWIVPVVLAAGWRGLRRPVVWPLALAAAAPLALAWGAYGLYPAPLYLAEVTWERMLLQAGLPLFLLLALALHSLLASVPLPWRAAREG